MRSYNLCEGGHALRIAFGITMMIFLLVSATNAATPISACGTISSPGEYVLTTSINNASTCIKIVSSDVIFDGAGYTINGTNTPGAYGVLSLSVSNSTTPLSNITVKNLTLTNWDKGIFLFESSNLTSNNASNNNYGIYLSDSSNNLLSGNNASNNNYGIYLDSSSSNNLIGNNANSNNIAGIALGSSSDNTLSGNNASNNNCGIYLDSSSNNILSGNNIVSSILSFFPNASINVGIMLQYSNNNMLIGNNISNFSNFFFPGVARKFGLVIDSSSGNNLSSNVISNNTNGILLYNSNDNTIYNNYFNNSLNAADDSNNNWNITKQLGTNILGGPYFGGNFWSDYEGNDTDGDRLGNTLIPYNSSGNITYGGDYLPLTLTLGVTQTVSNTGGTVTTDTIQVQALLHLILWLQV